MKKMDNKGFTLVELLATIIILSIIMGLAGYSVTAIIDNSREKEYQLLVKEIKNSVELYYQECKFVDNDCNDEITLEFLLNYGYLKGNSVGSGDVKSIVNPINKENISSCSIKYSYSGSNIVVENNGESSVCPDDEICCPTTNDYLNN